MRRIRWFDSEPDDPSMPVDWRIPVLILATLFLNFPFWIESNLYLWLPGPISRDAVLLLAGALLMVALFFVGPALATQAARRPLLVVAENSLGSIPAMGLRLCCICFLMCLIASFVLTVLWALPGIPLRAMTKSGWAAAGILAFVFITGLQSPAVRAKLALFTNKLGIAILAAALIRVRDGWPAIWQGPRESSLGSLISQEWLGLATISFYVAPLAFLAANFGHRSRGRKQVATIAVLGLALPLFGTLLVVGIIDVATFASSSYRPSLSPSVAMALWSDVAWSYLPGLTMLTAITMLGALRFGAKSLAELVLPVGAGRRMRWAVLASFIPAIAWLAIQNDGSLRAPFVWSATCLAVASAVLTVDFATARWRVEQARRIDWVGTIAMLAGCTAAWYLPTWIAVTNEDPWWHPRLLPAYGMGFLVCLIGRAAQRLRRAHRFDGAPSDLRSD